MPVIINRLVVMAPPQPPQTVRAVDPENRPQPGPTPRDVEQVVRKFIERRQRLEAN
jgi:hypothetical protein